MMIDLVQNKGRPAEVLLVEDNYGDVLLTMRAFKGANITNNVTVAASGEEAISILRREGKHKEVRSPDLILLDLNLPKINGHDVLSFIKNDPELRNIPVLILSSSCVEQDIVKSYGLHANGYIVKPVRLNQFIETVQKLEQFWFSLVVLPDLADKESA